eukprot:1160936-Pelagomonas_calceolata.AAC.9
MIWTNTNYTPEQLPEKPCPLRLIPQNALAMHATPHALAAASTPHLRVGCLARGGDGRGHKAPWQLLEQLLQQHTLLGAEGAHDHDGLVGWAYNIRHMLA